MVSKTMKKQPPMKRIFDGYEYELWTGEYGPDPEGHTKTHAKDYASDLRQYGHRARIVPYGGKYFIYFF
jgi:hypothetical protein